MPSAKRNNMYRAFHTLLLSMPLVMLSVSSAHAEDVEVTDARMRMLPGDLPAAGYFTLRNTSAAPVVLVGAQSAAFGMVEMHLSSSEGGMASMKTIPRLELAPNESIEFAPKGYHLMFMKPEQSLSVGDEVAVELQFEDDQPLSVKFQVVSPASM